MGALRLTRKLLLAAGVVAALALPSAAAARVQVASAPGIDGLSMAGTGVAFASVAPPNTVFVHRAGPGGQTRFARLRSFFDVEAFDASASHVALGLEPGYVDAPDDGAPHPLHGMPLSGPAGRSFAGCGRFPLVAVDGSSVAYRCSGDDHVTVRDLATGATSSIATGTAVFRIDIAGSFVAVERSVAPGQVEIAVFDRATGARVYSANAGEGQSPFSLQSDGKVAIVELGEARECVSRLTWHSPAEPQAHTLSTDACGLQVEMSGDQVAYERAGGRELVVSDLAGNARVVANFPVRRGLRSLSTLLEFDFEGGLVAYAERGCGPDPVYMDSASAPAVVAPGATSCPIKLLTRRTRLRGRVLTLRFRCPRGCRMLAGLTLNGRRGTYVKSEEVYALSPGQSRLRIRLSRFDVRFLRGLRSTTIGFQALARSNRLTQSERNIERRLRVRLR
jgi:hypothetical protein